MKNNKCVIILLLILSVNKHTILFSQSQKEVLFEKIIGSKYIDLDAKLKIDTMQYQSSRGITFSIEIINKSLYPVNIYNPLDFCYITIFNDKGSDISIPLCSKYEVGNFTGYKQFYLNKVTCNNAVLFEGLIDVDYINIPSNGNVEIFFGIDSVMQTESTSLGILKHKNILISGNYKINAYVSLVKDISNIEELFLDDVSVYYRNPL